ncbi:MAG: hypothetical protein RIR91_342 [Verrucomicrobiota bacterium]|jgi:hypothetical protein
MIDNRLMARFYAIDELRTIARRAKDSPIDRFERQTPAGWIKATISHKRCLWTLDDARIAKTALIDRLAQSYL